MQVPCKPDELLPSNAVLLRIVFTAAGPDGSQLIPGFIDPCGSGLCAWVLPETAPLMAAELLCVQFTPAAPAGSEQPLELTGGTAQDMPDSLLHWCASSPAARGRGAAFAALHNAQLAWAPGRAVVSADPQTMGLVFPALLEFAWLAGELEVLESQLNGRWSQLHADIPAAFHALSSSSEQQEQLRERFCKAIGAKARLVQIAPLIESPPLYPPTAASQAGERLREKGRLPERLETLREQLDTFIQIYELASQKLVDSAASRSSLQLEWAIVILLVFEVLLMLVEILSQNSV